jgi:hypothetical protein
MIHFFPYASKYLKLALMHIFYFYQIVLEQRNWFFSGFSMRIGGTFYFHE